MKSAFALILGLILAFVTPVAGQDPPTLGIGEMAEVRRPNRLADELRPVMQKELRLLFMVVEVDEATKLKIREDAESALFTVNDLIYSDVLNEEAGFALTEKARTHRGRSLCANPYHRLQAELTKIAKNHLTPDDCEKYEGELAAVREAKSAANIALVVCIIDRYLGLTKDQKTAIGDKLAREWTGVLDNDVLFHSQDNPQSVPEEISVLIATELSLDQAEIWREIPKYHNPIQVHILQDAVRWE